MAEPGWPLIGVKNILTKKQKDKLYDSGVSLLDCESDKWHHVTFMSVARVSLAARLVDRKIYVLGGCKDKNSSD